MVGNIMTFITCVCPNCGDNTQIDEKLTEGYCIYCGSKVINDKAVEILMNNRNEDTKNLLNLAKESIELQKWDRLSNYIADIIAISKNCPDVWFMRALLAKVRNDNEANQKYLYVGRMYQSNSFGVFEEKDIFANYGYEITFVPILHPALSTSLRDLQNESYCLTVDNDAYTIKEKRSIGMRPGNHKVKCYHRVTINGKLVKTPVKTINEFKISEDATFVLKYDNFTLDVIRQQSN